MGHAISSQPPKGAKVSRSSPLGRGITAHFLFDGDFKSAVRNRSGNPVVTAGPTFKSGPRGTFAQGTGAGRVVTDLLPSQLGVAGASPRTFIVEYWVGDTAAPKAVFSMGDSSIGPLTQTSLLIGTGYRECQLALYGTDVAYAPWLDGGTAGRVFLAITYDGNLSLKFRSWARVENASTGAYIKTVFRTQDTTLPDVLKTGNTVPLCLMGTGTYTFSSMDTALHHLSIYGGRCLTPSEIDSLYADRHQVLSQPSLFPYEALSASAVVAEGAALSGTASSAASVSGALTTSIRLAGTAAAQVSASGAVTSAISMAAVAATQTIASATLTAAIRMTAAAVSQTTASSALTTSVPLAAGVLVAASLTGALGASGTGMAAAALVSSTASGSLVTQIRFAGTAAAQGTATATLASAIQLAGAATAQATASGALTSAIPLSGAAVSSASLSASFAGAGAALAAAALVQAYAAAGLVSSIPLGGAAAARAAATGALSTAIPLTGTAVGQATATAALLAPFKVRADLTGTYRIAGAVRADLLATYSILGVIANGVVAAPVRTVTFDTVQIRTVNFVAASRTVNFVAANRTVEFK